MNTGLRIHLGNIESCASAQKAVAEIQAMLGGNAQGSHRIGQMAELMGRLADDIDEAYNSVTTGELPCGLSITTVQFLLGVSLGWEDEAIARTLNRLQCLKEELEQIGAVNASPEMMSSMLVELDRWAKQELDEVFVR